MARDLETRDRRIDIIRRFVRENLRRCGVKYG